MQPRGSFITYCKQQKHYLWWALVIGFLYFIILRLLYPVPSYFADSFTYVGAAASNRPVSFRPVMYSKLIQFFRLLSTSEIALIAGQYFSILLANLFLFFSASWLFQFNKWQKNVLFAILVMHPFFLFSANYISSDAFFTSFTIGWFTLLLWIMYKPKWYIILVHAVLLMMVFMLRYNAIYFPFITAIALVFSPLNRMKKSGIMVVIAALIFTFIEYTGRATEKFVGTKVFTAFSGWQFANNALHIVRFKEIDTTEIKDKSVKELLRYSQQYFHSSKDTIPVNATAWYMWHPNSPLKKYMKVRYPKAAYFRAWNNLAPVYEKFGKTIILQNPTAYVQHFVLPNTKEYFLPRLEIYDTYFENVDTVAKVATKYYLYKNNKASEHKPAVYAIAFTGWPQLFLLVNIALLLAGTWYIIKRKYLYYSKLINQFLLLFAAFFAANFLFIVLLAPSVLRYHIPVLTVALPVVLFLISPVVRSKQKKYG